ncbi:DUF1080 domain-containing protein [Bacteroidota bacterium]
MKTTFTFLSTIMVLLMVSSCNQPEKIELFNGKDLSNWTKTVKDENVDKDTVFWVEDGVIQVSGKPNGYIRTNEKYSNYKLHVEWRWAAEPKNSGILFHFEGEDKVWPSTIECQLHHGDAGDLILIDGEAVINGVKYPVMDGERKQRAHKKFEESSEKPVGEWNSADITCDGNTFEFVINRVLQMKGTEASKSMGNICLQSEGGPIQFRNVYLELL